MFEMGNFLALFNHDLQHIYVFVGAERRDRMESMLILIRLNICVWVNVFIIIILLLIFVCLENG